MDKTSAIDFRRRRLVGLLLTGAASGGLGGWSLLARAQSHARHAGETGGAAAELAGHPHENRVVVLTSYAEELVAPFRQAFERRHPGRRVEILWRHSADALAYLRRGGSREVDVYWTPAPRNFAILKAEGLLAKLDLDTGALPSHVANYPISDPDGHFAAFELAGYGILYNPETVGKLGLSPPRDWHDLADPAYRGQVQLPIPGRVGFAPVLIEAVLQGYGWDEGWATLAGIAANVDFGGGDSAPDTDDIVIGRKAARMTIDFFAAASRKTDTPLSFIYPPRTAFNPSQVAIFANAPHPVAAREFVDFVLSPEGQEMLLHPDVRRLPVRKEIYDAHPELTAQPFAPGNLAYDDALRRSRQGLVAALFEIALVEAHKNAVPLWSLLHRAEQEGRGAADDRQEIRSLLAAVPVNDAAQTDGALRRLFDFPDRTPGEPEPPPAPERQAIEARWRADIAARFDRARQKLQSL
ncbi:MAG: extracellular solute-binding protein [Zoogloeaceae bacterium]|jgi:ABC-type Fe3+ transport system substrate-binding protein|nr:extracellular solute-binding protein [Zoogloeaceae bacterium]